MVDGRPVGESLGVSAGQSGAAASLKYGAHLAAHGATALVLDDGGEPAGRIGCLGGRVLDHRHHTPAPVHLPG